MGFFCGTEGEYVKHLEVILLNMNFIRFLWLGLVWYEKDSNLALLTSFNYLFVSTEVAGSAAPIQSQESNEMLDINKGDSLLVKRKKTSKEHIESKKKKSKKKGNEILNAEKEQSLPDIQKKASKEHKGRKMLEYGEKGQRLKGRNTDAS